MFTMNTMTVTCARTIRSSDIVQQTGKAIGNIKAAATNAAPAHI